MGEGIPLTNCDQLVMSHLMKSLSLLGPYSYLALHFGPSVLCLWYATDTSEDINSLTEIIIMKIYVNCVRLIRLKVWFHSSWHDAGCQFFLHSAAKTQYNYSANRTKSALL